MELWSCDTTSRAFCPGHITGFFSIENEGPNPLKRGSRGIGFCIELGATAEVTGNSSGIQILINGRTASAPVSRTALERIISGSQAGLKVMIETQLPESQGFGLSAAGTFAASLAAAHHLQFENPKERALEVTHRAEVHHITGLGDAPAQSVGGFVFRQCPGIPPFGKLKPLGFSGDVALCTLGLPIKTRETLTHPEIRPRIIEVGSYCIEEFSDSQTLDSFFDLSWQFARETKLASPEIIKAVDIAKKNGQASMVMLGNSIFAMGDIEELVETLKPYSTIIVTKVETRGGARPLI